MSMKLNGEIVCLTERLSWIHAPYQTDLIHFAVSLLLHAGYLANAMVVYDLLALRGLKPTRAGLSNHIYELRKHRKEAHKVFGQR